MVELSRIETLASPLRISVSQFKNVALTFDHGTRRAIGEHGFDQCESG